MASTQAPTTLRTTRRRPLLVVLVVLMVAMWTTPASATRVRTNLERHAEERFLVAHDQVRGSIGALAEYRDVRDVARRWADNMAGRQQLGHNPNYPSEVCCHELVAENVARAAVGPALTADAVDAAVDRTMDEFMGSAGHRDNILRREFDQVGVGVNLVHVDGGWYLYVTTNFRAADGSEPDDGVPRARDIRDTCGSDTRPSFSDITSSNVHAAAIACIENAGITNGHADGTYGAKDLLSRGQVATFLLRTLEAAGIQPPAERPCTSGAHASGLSAMIAWGVFDDRSCDGSPVVERSDMAVWSVRAMQGPMGLAMPAVQWDLFFDDNALSPQTQGTHNAIAELGIVTGVGNDQFAPTSALRRDQMATFLARILDAWADR